MLGPPPAAALGTMSCDPPPQWLWEGGVSIPVFTDGRPRSGHICFTLWPLTQTQDETLRGELWRGGPWGLWVEAPGLAWGGREGVHQARSWETGVCVGAQSRPGRGNSMSEGSEAGLLVCRETQVASLA